METTENKLIAEFMEYKNPSNAADIWYHYDTSWDWLMPVVEKIYGLGLDNENALLVRDAVAEANRKETYKAVVEFIKYYNQKKED